MGGEGAQKSNKNYTLQDFDKLLKKQSRVDYFFHALFGSWGVTQSQSLILTLQHLLWAQTIYFLF